MAKSGEVLELLLEYMDAYPTGKLSEKGLEVYVRKLAELDLGKLRKAMDKLLETCRFFPTIADIYGEVEKMPKTLEELRREDEALEKAQASMSIEEGLKQGLIYRWEHGLEEEPEIFRGAVQ